MRSSSSLLALLGLGLVLGGCAPAQEPEDPEPLGKAVQAVTVAEAAGNSCATSSVKGLSLQIAAQGACIQPGSFVEVPQVANVVFADTVLPFLEQPARDALVAALGDAPGTSMQVNSMLRTVAQQYLLYQWYLAGTCGIALAAKPGASNHETGLALDVQQYNTWKPQLTAHGFQWYGAADTVHFDYVGAGAVNYKGTDVLAFQILWNENHPADLIAEDGDYGPQTEARLKQSPADGFALGADCAQKPPQPDMQLGASFGAPDDYADGASAGRADVFEGDTRTVELIVSNTGGAPATNAEIRVEVTGTYLSAVDYLIETDYGHPGTFEINDANDDPSNPMHGAPLGPAFGFELTAFAKGETKRVTLTVSADVYSIEPDAAPEVHFWVKDVPGAYHQDAWGGPADNVDGSQTYNGGSLQAAAPVDIYSHTQWLWDTDRREGWEAVAGAQVATHADVGALSVAPSGEGLAVQSALLAVPTDTFAGVEISGRLSGAGQAYLYFSTDDSPAFDDSQRIALTLPSQGDFQTTTVGTAAQAGWTGNLTRLGLGVDGGGTLEIDALRLVVEGGDNGEGGAGTGGSGAGASGGSGGGGGANEDSPTRHAMCSCDVPGGSLPGSDARSPLLGALAALGIVLRRSRRRAR
jgi:hypothetical protein